MMRRAAVAGLLLAALAHPAWGQTCSAIATEEAFGTYDPFSGAPTTSTANVAVTCSSSTPVLVGLTISLDGGGSGLVGARSMSGGAWSLPYQLYRDVARTQIWGDGTGGSTAMTDSYLLSVVTPVTRNYPAYGIIPGRARVGAGQYGDRITVLLTY